MKAYSKIVHPENLRIKAAAAAEVAAAAAKEEVEVVAQLPGVTPSAEKSGIGARGSTILCYFHKPVLILVKANGVRRYVFKCRIQEDGCGSECGVTRNQDGTGSGSLFAHVKTKHPEVYEKLCALSTHTRRQEVWL